MPKVGTYESRVSSTALPSARRQAQQPAVGGEGLQEFGRTLARSGEAFADLAIRIRAEEQDRADKDALLEADNRLDKLETNLLTAPDVGALITMRGKQALGAREKVLPSFDEQAGMVASALTTERQRAAFAHARAERRSRIENRLNAHVTTEMAAFRKGEALAGIDSALNMAVANSKDPARVAEFLDKGDTIVDTYAADLGLVGDEAKQAFKDAFRTKTLEGVIADLQSQDLDDAAKAYFDELEGQISGEARARIRAKVQAGVRTKRALETSEALWAQFAPPPDDDDSPISIDKMEAAAREKFKDDPEVYKLTVTFLREKLQGVEVGRKARVDDRDDAVWRAVAEGASFAQVRSMPQYRSMPGKVQNQIVDYFNNKAYTAEARAAARESRLASAAAREDAAEARALRKQERDGFAQYLDIVTNPDFANLSTADVRRMLPELGPALTQRTLNELEQVKSAVGQLRAPRLDADVFKSAVADAGYKYVLSTPSQLTPEQKANLGRLRTEVEDALSLAQQAQGVKALEPAEQRKIIEGVLDQKVTLRDRGALWYDAEVPAVFVGPDGRSSAYVPIASIPAPALAEALNYLRGLPGNTRKSDAELRGQYRNRLERAYGVSKSGGTRDEVTAILDGKVR